LPFKNVAPLAYNAYPVLLPPAPTRAAVTCPPTPRPPVTVTAPVDVDVEAVFPLKLAV